MTPAPTQSADKPEDRERNEYLPGDPGDHGEPESSTPAPDEHSELITSDENTEPPEEPASQTSDHDLKKNLNQLQNTLFELKQGLEEQNKSTPPILNRIHTEFQTYKEDVFSRAHKAMSLRLIETIDAMQKLTQAHAKNPPEKLDARKLLKQLESFPDELIEILYEQGVEHFHTDLTHPVPFDPKRHTLIHQVDTQDPTQDKHLATSLRSGYEWQGKLLRREWVEVYIYTPATEQSISVEEGSLLES